MAATTRPASATVEDDLRRRPHEFSFLQAMRLLGMLAAGRDVELRVRPALSLCFPAADVVSLDKEHDRYLLQVAFLGLYGQGSPLPTFYTEQLLDESGAELSGGRDFLDILNHRLLSLFYDCTTKYRLFFRVAQQGHEECLLRLLCLIGMGEPSYRRRWRPPGSHLRHAALLSMQARSALGLARLLADRLLVPVKIVQCLERRVRIPSEQRTLLGALNCALGMNAVLGQEVMERSSKIRVRLGPLAPLTFASFLPGSSGRELVEELVDLYVPDPLVWDLELVLCGGPIPSVVLGGETGRQLGCDSWLGHDDALPDASVVFPGVS